MKYPEGTPPHIWDEGNDSRTPSFMTSISATEIMYIIVSDEQISMQERSTARPYH
jgi:hypothetical protein